MMQSRAMYIRDRQDNQLNFFDKFIAVILGQKVMQVERYVETPISQSYLEGIESGEIEQEIKEDVIEYKPDQEHVKKKWRNFYQRVRISNYLDKFLAPLYDDIDQVFSLFCIVD